MEITSIRPNKVKWKLFSWGLISLLIKVNAVSGCGCGYKELVNEKEALLTDFQGCYE